jgi:integrase
MITARRGSDLNRHRTEFRQPRFQDKDSALRLADDRTKFKRHAYTPDEVAGMLAKLPEAARTLAAVAAFSGLRHGEIRGPRWEDYDGQSFQVQRSIWRTHVGETKTGDSAGAVPVIPFLQKILTATRSASEHQATYSQSRRSSLR